MKMRKREENKEEKKNQQKNEKERGIMDAQKR